MEPETDHNRDEILMTKRQGISRTKITGIVAGLVLVVLFFIILLPGNKQPMQAATCLEETVRFEFSGLVFCFEAGEILQRMDVPLTNPAIHLELLLDGKPVEISVLQLDDKHLTGGLHTHLGLSVAETFQLLLMPDETPDATLAKRILDVNANTWIRHKNVNGLDIYALVRLAE